MVNVPYSEFTQGSFIVREFDISLDDEEYIWHRDRNNRIIFVIESDSWLFQFDNCMPVILTPGDTLFIKKMSYHRIIKGKNNLKILIQEL